MIRRTWIIFGSNRFASLLVATALILTAMWVGGQKVALANRDGGNTISVYRTVNFQVNYRDGASPGVCSAADGDFQAWSEDAKTAMNHVVDILDDLVNSSVPIVIDACFQELDDNGSFLAFAGETANYTKAMVSVLPIANRTYPVALTNAISGSDQNGSTSELFAVANSASPWDYCTTGCTVASDHMDFVSTMVHELLHGLGFGPSFDQNQDDPTLGSYREPPSVFDDYVVQVSDGSKLLDLANNSVALMNAMQQGSGTVAFNGPHTKAINNGNAPFLYTPKSFSVGSSIAHWDDDHSSNLGRLMNAATFGGPSARVVDAVTLMVLKDIGWNVNDASDYGDSTLAAYGSAQHINGPGYFAAIILGATFSSESAPAADDASDDGVTRSPTWTAGTNGGQITVSMASSQAGATGCLSGWIDWNEDGDFADGNEVIVDGIVAPVGSQQLTFSIPNSVSDTAVYNARFRLSLDWDNDGACSDQVATSASGGVLGGEVEDYQWQLDEQTIKEPPVTEKVFLPLVARQ